MKKDPGPTRQYVEPTDPEVLEWLDRRLGLSDINVSKPLLGRPKAFPDEVLSYYVARLAQRNGVAWRHLVSHLGVKAGQKLPLLDTELNFSLLRALAWQVNSTEAYSQRLLRLPFRCGGARQEDVYLLRTAEILDVGGSGHLASWLQYCSLCLKEDPRPYFRRKWRLVSVTCCQRHGCLLHDRCPICKSPPSQSDFSLSCCGQPYSAAPITPASDEAMALEAWQSRTMQALLVRQNTLKEDKILRLHFAAMSWLSGDTRKLPEMSPRERHRLNADLARAISAINPKGSDTIGFDVKNLDFDTAPFAWSEFCALLAKFPDGIDLQTFAQYVAKAGFKPEDIDAEMVWMQFHHNPAEMSAVLERLGRVHFWKQHLLHWMQIADSLGKELPFVTDLEVRI